jgi:hypothetical protein
MNNFPTRPAEHTHEIKCVFDATKSALENLRDFYLEQDTISHVGFILEMQDNNAYHNARMYLEEGITICRCEPCPYACCEHLVGTGEDIRPKERPQNYEEDWVYGGWK